LTWRQPSQVPGVDAIYGAAPLGVRKG
jgi:hypothetical protein